MKLWTQIILNLWGYTICMGVGSLTICNRVKCFGTPNKYSLWHNGITFVICLLECAYWHVASRYPWHKYMKDSPFKIWGHMCRWLPYNFQALERNKWKYSRTLCGYWVSVMFPSCSLSQRERTTQKGGSLQRGLFKKVSLPHYSTKIFHILKESP